MGAEAKLVELGVELPPPVPPAGNYVSAVRSGNLVFASGAGPIRGDGTVITGKVGRDVSLDEAREAARVVAVNLLTAVRGEVGTLDAVTRIVKVLGMVNCAPGFHQTPAVIDGCSDFLVSVFGEAIGKHARSAVGMAELPFDIAVEIEMIVEVA
jgi:enamine deaminase RidA (YjgF/YER057c/UK114 family)